MLPGYNFTKDIEAVEEIPEGHILYIYFFQMFNLKENKYQNNYFPALLRTSYLSNKNHLLPSPISGDYPLKKSYKLKTGTYSPRYFLFITDKVS
jgi:hypothetical protein